MPKRRIQGTVVSDKMDKSVVVSVDIISRHPLYHKVIRHHERFKAHDGANEAIVGDRVIIEECRPLSRTKRWRVVEWVHRAERLT